MLSIGKMVAGSENYYLNSVAKGREEYYTGSGEAPGQWLGLGAHELGLSGQVDPDHLRSVLAGIAPDGRSLTAGRVRPDGRVSGFDFTYSAPKSVSLLYGLGDHATSETVRRAHAEAVADALGYLERSGLRVRRGAGGEHRIKANGFIAAAFQHRTSRSGDPQLHTHVLVANAAHGIDGVWSAPDARLLYFHARTAGFLYQAALRASLVNSLGVRFGPVVNGTAEIEGISTHLLRSFSARRADIDRHLAATGGTSARAAEVAALLTRAPKEPHPGNPTSEPKDLRARWRAQAEDLALDDPGLIDVLGHHTPKALEQSEVDAFIATLVGPAGLCANDSSFERRDVVRAVAQYLRDGGSVSAVETLAEHVLAHADVIPLPSIGRGGELRHTTTELLAIETALTEKAAARSMADVGHVEPDYVEVLLENVDVLAQEQRNMVRRLTTSGAGVEAVIGRAGTGKTTALAVAADAWTTCNFEVLGAALSARAAQALEDGAEIQSTTIARLFHALDTGVLSLGPHNVLIVDEAGMVGTRALGRLIDDTAAAGAKLVLVGDPRQLPEIDAGGAFAGVIATVGAIELVENHRQEQTWERIALDELRHGDPIRGLLSFDNAERVHHAPTMAEARQQLVDAWSLASLSGDDVVMLAVNRTDIAALNALARQALRNDGVLGPDLAQSGDSSFAKGDVVVCLRNDRCLDVLNGTRGTVRSVSDEGIVINTEKGRRTLSPEYLAQGFLTHGYATTIHKAQGATVDRAFVLVTDSMTREAGYVAMSRARKSTDLFIPISAFEDGIVINAFEAREKNPLHAVEKRFLVSKAKQLALDFIPGGSSPDHGLDDATDHLHTASDHRNPRGNASPPEVVNNDRWTRSNGEQIPRSPSLEARPEDRYLVPMLGRRPAFQSECLDYDTITRAVDSYRHRYGVTGDNALGSRPFEAIQRLAYDDVLDAVSTYQRRLGRSIEMDGPHRSPGRGR